MNMEQKFQDALTGEVAASVCDWTLHTVEADRITHLSVTTPSCDDPAQLQGHIDRITTLLRSLAKKRKRREGIRYRVTKELYGDAAEVTLTIKENT